MTSAGIAAKALSVLLLAGVFPPTEAKAQEGYHGHRHSALHDSFYRHLIRPDANTPCCDGADCRPTSGRAVGDHYEVKVNGRWIPVPENKIVKEAAPDLGFHVCAGRKFGGQPHQLYCVILPPES
jgi:hypothetical protein